MKKGASIGLLILAGVCLAPLWAQGPSGSMGLFENRSYEVLAGRDAEYEHSLVFATPVDEADYWNDQRAFEQKLLERNPANYMSYLQGKKKSYLRHGETCSSQCGHGDYYYRQASFYMQHNSGGEGMLLTLIKSESTGVWKLSYADSKHH